MTDRINISHSEADSFTLCERRHYYSFGERLEKKVKSTALQRGLTGHEMFEVFFKAFQSTRDLDKAKSALTAYATEQITAANIETLGYLLNTMTGFINHYEERILSWQIVEVEVAHKLTLRDFDYSFKPDLLVREKGVLKLIDYKFTYDFYEPYMLALSPQIPRYIGAMRALGIPVEGGYYAFLRYRTLKNDGEGVRFKLEPSDPSHDRIKNSFQDLILSVEPVAAKRKLTLEQWSQNVRRAAMQQICKYCNFQKLCAAELNGSDGKMIRFTDYQKSTYGYTEEENV